MTIEDCKNRLVTEKELAIKTGLNHDANGTLADAVDVAVGIMCKYQKIREIVENNNGFTDGTLEHSKAFTKIAEVIEDGQNIIND